MSNTHKQYTNNSRDLLDFILKWFHNQRVEDFANFIDKGDQVALSVGSGNGSLETNHLEGVFSEVYGLDIRRDRVEEAKNNGLDVIHASAPPLPFKDNSLDVVLSIGTVEHLPDERGFFKEARRCLRSGGKIYVTIPIEVGLGGLLRFWGRCLVHPSLRDTSSNGWRQFFEYTTDELLKQTPQDKHGLRHRYYNYMYAVKDLRELFTDVELEGWPIKYTGSLNLIYMAKGVTPAGQS